MNVFKSNHCSLIIAFLFLLNSTVYANKFSYVYIQGDKITPFYVKLNGNFVARYGKNYCIIPSLNPGKIEVEILFQLSLYPPRHFTIQVPENGSKGFLLTNKSDGYVLYDLENKTYLQPNK